MLEDIGVFGDLDIKHLDTICSVKFPDFEFDIAPGVSAFQEQLIELVPKEKEGIEKLFNTMKRLNEETSALQENPPEGIGPDEFADKYPLHTKYMKASNDDFLSDHVQDPKIPAILNHLTAMFGQPPHRMAALVYMSILYDLVSEANDYIQGGVFSQPGTSGQYRQT
ncbi:MAG: hypothetical protein JRH15_16560 [Deltaproteobacteria bacterium]|nr:hypothetical protein [Deltaproteobacteria bacterium]